MYCLLFVVVICIIVVVVGCNVRNFIMERMMLGGF